MNNFNILIIAFVLLGNFINAQSIIDCKEVRKDPLQVITTPELVFERNDLETNINKNNLKQITKCFFQIPEVQDTIINRYKLSKDYIEKFGEEIMLGELIKNNTNSKKLHTYLTNKSSFPDKIKDIYLEYYPKKYITRSDFAYAETSLLMGKNYDELNLNKIYNDLKFLIEEDFEIKTVFIKKQISSQEKDSTNTNKIIIIDETVNKILFKPDLNKINEYSNVEIPNYINYLFFSNEKTCYSIAKKNEEYFLAWYEYALYYYIQKEINNAKLKHLIEINENISNYTGIDKEKINKILYPVLKSYYDSNYNFDKSFECYLKMNNVKQFDIKNYNQLIWAVFNIYFYQNALDDNNGLVALKNALFNSITKNEVEIINSFSNYNYDTQLMFFDFFVDNIEDLKLKKQLEKYKVKELSKKIKEISYNFSNDSWYAYLNYVFFNPIINDNHLLNDALTNQEITSKIISYNNNPSELINSFLYRTRIYQNLKSDVLRFAMISGISTSNYDIAPYLLEYCTYYIIWQLVYNQSPDYENIKEIIQKVEEETCFDKNLKTEYFIEKKMLYLIKKKYFPELLKKNDYKDKEAPYIIVTSPSSDNNNIMTNKIIFEGFVNDFSDIKTLTINSIPIQFNKNTHSFKKEVNLEKGINKFEIIAVDEFNNISKLNNTIVYNPIQGNNYAYFIGIDNYENSTTYPILKNPINDAKAISKELKENFGFEIQNIDNPSINELIQFLKNTNKREYNENDQLFIFFAGHGEFDKDLKMGYIVPKDGKKGLDNTFLPYSYLEDLLSKHKCKHIFLVVDVCYSGTFFESIAQRSGNPNDQLEDITDKIERDKFISNKLKYISRKAMTSSGKEPVLDGTFHSPFAKAFLAFLRSTKNDKVYTISSLSSYLENIPPYPKIGGFGNDEIGGDFIFIRK